MSIQTVKGDILGADSGVIFHGVNCQGVMGSGVAKALRDFYPDLFQPYSDKVQDHRKRNPNDSGKGLLGDILPVCVKHSSGLEPPLWIVNLFTQQYYGKDGKLYLDYWALGESLSKLAVWISTNLYPYTQQFKHLPINFPKIGAGTAGGDWGKIQQMIEQRLPDDKGYQNKKLWIP